MSDNPTLPNSDAAELAKLLDVARQSAAELENEKNRHSELAASLSEQIKSVAAERESLKAASDELNAQRAAIKTAADEAKKVTDELTAAQTAASQDIGKIADIGKELEHAKSQAMEMQTQLDGQRKNISAQLSEITSIVEQFDAKRDELNGASAEVSKIKTKTEEDGSAIATARETAKKTQDALSGFENSSAASRDKLVSLEKNVSTKITDLDASLKSLEGDRDALSTVLSEINQIRSDAEKGKTKALEDVTEISSTKDKFDILKAQAQAANDELGAKKGEVVEKIAEIHAAYDRVKQQKDELIEDRLAADGSPQKSIATIIREKEAELRKLIEEATKAQLGVQSDWDGMKSDFTTERTSLLALSKTQFETLKSRLEKEIQELLPGAGAAGLSWAYVDAKAKYGPSKFVYVGNETDSKIWKVFPAWLVYSIQSFATPLFLYAIFLGPLIPVFLYFRDLLDFAKDHPKDLTVDLLLLRAAISVPLLTVSVFGLSSIRLYRRLYEEYNHKQRVMQLYDSFKREFAKVGDPEQQKALLTIMLATVGDKPSLAMHKYDTVGEVTLPSVNLAGMLGDIFKSKSSEGSA